MTGPTGLKGTTARLAVVASMLAWCPAAAQTAPATVDASAETGLEDIVVTAQRRAQSLQDAPVAVTALGAEDLANRQITNASDLLAKLSFYPAPPRTWNLAVRYNFDER